MYKFLANDLKVFAKNLNVLIVEDELSLGSELQELLSLFFNKVYNAVDGEQGLEYYKRFKCDIVITDLNMPKMNGVELSKQIRILNKEQVIMVLSGHIDVFVIDLIDIGIQTLILKPYDLEIFLQKLLVQCENVVLKKQFDKMKLNVALNTYSDRANNTYITPSTNTNISFEKIAQEVVKVKPKEEVINDYISNFNINHKIDDSMWKHISEDIQDLNQAYEENINKIALNGFNESIRMELIRIFYRYNSSLLLIPGLDDLAAIFNDLGFVLEDVDLDSLEDDNLGLFDIFEFFYEDIIKFFNIVFVDQEISNVNYLTDSMKSSVFQLKVKLGLESLDDEEELELF